MQYLLTCSKLYCTRYQLRFILVTELVHTESIEPGLSMRNRALSHCASVHMPPGNPSQNLAVGMAFTSLPSTVELSFDQSRAEGNCVSPGRLRHLGLANAQFKGDKRQNERVNTEKVVFISLLPGESNISIRRFILNTC